MRFRRWLKSRHIWSRSGGPSPPGFLPSCFLLSPSGLWPQRGSLSDNLTPRRLIRETSMLSWSDVGDCLCYIGGRRIFQCESVAGIVLLFEKVTQARRGFGRFANRL